MVRFQDNEDDVEPFPANSQHRLSVDAVLETEIFVAAAGGNSLLANRIARGRGRVFNDNVHVEATDALALERICTMRLMRHTQQQLAGTRDAVKRGPVSCGAPPLPCDLEIQHEATLKKTHLEGGIRSA